MDRAFVPCVFWDIQKGNNRIRAGRLWKIRRRYQIHMQAQLRPFFTAGDLIYGMHQPRVHAILHDGHPYHLLKQAAVMKQGESCDSAQLFGRNVSFHVFFHKIYTFLNSVSILHSSFPFCFYCACKPVIMIPWRNAWMISLFAEFLYCTKKSWPAACPGSLRAFYQSSL